MEPLDLGAIASCFVLTEIDYVCIFLEEKCNKHPLQWILRCFNGLHLLNHFEFLNSDGFSYTYMTESNISQHKHTQWGVHDYSVGRDANGKTVASTGDQARENRVLPFGVAENGSLVHLEGAIQFLSGWDSFEKSEKLF